MYTTELSEFEIEKQYIKIGSDGTFTDMSCIGTSDEELEVKTVTKSCAGTVVKTATRGTGNGTLTESLHMPYDIYNEIFGMNSDLLIDGAHGYGKESLHPEFALTQKVEDEDGIALYKAYPRCVLQSGPKVSIDNSATEVAEVKLEIALLPDDNGFCQYHMSEDELSAAVLTETTWLTAFDSSIVTAS